MKHLGAGKTGPQGKRWDDFQSRFQIDVISPAAAAATASPVQWVQIGRARVLIGPALLGVILKKDSGRERLDFSTD